MIAVQARHVIGAKAADMIITKTSNATAVKAAHVTSTEATHVAPAEAAAHMASATSTSMSSTSTAAAGLCTRGKKAASKHCACQNHHHSSSHDILHLRWADFPPSGLALADQRGHANVAIDRRWECLFVVPTKLAFIRIEGIADRLGGLGELVQREDGDP
jgi:hypothetical protein